ncbi:retroviral-like aspartic protease family protein [Nitrospirillum sp. BR 11752]|uniref:retroviral-like aspartic protease family protein n=1 Tax=Nitrospirillum sp. BR 11752 TaxID=3104293 RepID=UPI002EBC09DE|nr:retroviral-like aspartic protease family protein [Nitrospirillum sp. BR 11752]
MTTHRRRAFRRLAGALLSLTLACAAPGPHGRAWAGEDKPKCQLLRVGTLALTMDANMPLLDVGVNGQDGYLIMDTGATFGTITKPAAKRLNLSGHWVPGIYMEGVGGRVSVEEARLDELRLGDWKAHHVDYPVFTNHDLSDNEKIFGVMGENFLSKFDLDIDIAHNNVGLFQPKDCEDFALAYWTDTFNEAEFSRFSRENPKIWLKVQINGEEIRAILDTGASTSILTERAAARAGLTPESPGVTRTGKSVGIGDDLVQDYVGVFDSFRLGDEEIKHVRLRFGELFSHGGRDMPEMLLGLDFLRAHHMFISHGQRKIYFSYVGGPVFQVMGPRLRRESSQPEPAAEGTPPADQSEEKK